MGEIRVEFHKITKRFAGRPVLRGISGQVSPGRVLVVTGPNGSGKSTLLNVLAGLLRPSEGTVRYLEGQQALPQQVWHRILGVCAPDMAVYQEFSALENLSFFCQLRGLSRSQSELAELLQGLGLAAGDLRRPVGQFSSGMLQRVKLAQALVHDPQVLLLDEPSSNLDAAGHQLLAALVGRFRTRAAVVVATNDPREVTWGDEILELAA
ncbi:MAG: ABC transporter ATP-binding protein [Thermoanaerobaculum sp.]|nr:ABC transporter ATP-binding protein [Thermoanaerobaculum sp.]